MISLGHVSANCSLNYSKMIDRCIFSDFYSFAARNEWGPESRATSLQRTHVNVRIFPPKGSVKKENKYICTCNNHFLNCRTYPLFPKVVYFRLYDAAVIIINFNIIEWYVLKF